MSKLLFWTIVIVVLDSVLGTIIMKYGDPIGFAQKYPLPVMLVTGAMLLGFYGYVGKALTWIKQKV